MKKVLEKAELILDNKHIDVSGVLSFATVPQLRQKGNQYINYRSEVVFDFHKVTRSDSSALALLIAWTRLAELKNKKIKFINLPKQLAEIAKMSRLNKILPIEK